MKIKEAILIGMLLAAAGSVSVPCCAAAGELVVSEAVPYEGEEDISGLASAEPVTLELADGEYSIDVDLTGGSGKTYVVSPTVLTVTDGKAYAKLEWSSANYDYMVIGAEKFLPVSMEGSSVFEIPVSVMDEEMRVLADTTAMGTPHEVHYVLNFYSDSIGPKSQMPQEAAKRVLAIALAIIVGGGVLNYFVKKRSEY